MKLSQIIAPTVASFRANWRPILLIQAMALLMAGLYYTVPSVRSAADSIAEAKSAFGLWFSVVLMWLSSIALPEAAKLVTRQGRDRWTIRELTFLLVYFALVALILESWYSLISHWFGPAPTGALLDRVIVLIEKVLLDQFGLSLLVTMPMATVGFLWRDRDFQWSRVLVAAKDGELLFRYVRTVAMCFMFWPPVVVALYLLPYSLQYLVSVLCNAAWSILIVYLSGQALAAARAETMSETA